MRSPGLVAGIAIAGCLLLPAAVHAQDKRPSEDEMFGGSGSGDAKPAPTPTPPTPPPPPAPPAAGAPPTPPPAGAPPPPPAAPPAAAGGALPPPSESGEPVPTQPSEPPAAAASTANRDATFLGNPEAGPQLSGDVAPENPLTIGGQLYLRTMSTVLAHTAPKNWTLTSPNLLDTYFDARPNERVRAFIRGRLSYDPTAPISGATSLAGVQGMSSGGALAGSSATGFTTFNANRGPNTVLDQMWISFDIEHAVFVTAGKQHVKWGTGRFWTPTDYLHPIKRNPLDVFDARPGTTMLKLHFPWESRAWNFYAFGVIEDPNGPSNTLGQIAGAGRAELVQGPAELGLDFLAKRGQKPRVGGDFSVGVGDFDLYTDVGLRAGSEIPVVTFIGANGLCPTDLSKQYHVGALSGVKPQVVGGFTWSRKYNDNDVLNVGGEYFYNSFGYADPSIYPGLLLNDKNTPMLNFFYTGRHYAALFASLPAPYSWNYTTFTLSTIGNLSDFSFVSRLDYSVTLLTHLTFEAFAAVHYGHLGGEFRLGFDIATQSCDPVTGMPVGVVSAIHQEAPIVDLGLALRLAI